jgi:hypothetical protein
MTIIKVQPCNKSVIFVIKWLVHLQNVGIEIIYLMISIIDGGNRFCKLIVIIMSVEL